MTITQRIGIYLTNDRILAIYQEIMCHANYDESDEEKARHQVLGRHSACCRVTYEDFAAVYDVAFRSIELVKDSWRRDEKERERQEDEDRMAAINVLDSMLGRVAEP